LRIRGHGANRLARAYPQAHHCGNSRVRVLEPLTEACGTTEHQRVRSSIHGVTAPGRRTRERLLDVAEQLFGERGIDAVSLREIRLAAGARNAAAVQFHFENRTGLLQALTERHMPGIAGIQRDLYERLLEDNRENDARSLIEVLVRPAAVYLLRGPSERAWVKMMSDLMQRPDLRITQMVSEAPEIAQKVGAALYLQLCESMSPAIAQQRIVTLVQMSLYLCADRARVEDDHRATRMHLEGPVFVENLVDMVYGALFAAWTPPNEARKQPDRD
jgi:AcrR family transcriptional regulator